MFPGCQQNRKEKSVFNIVATINIFKEIGSKNYIRGDLEQIHEHGTINLSECLNMITLIKSHSADYPFLETSLMILLTAITYGCLEKLIV